MHKNHLTDNQAHQDGCSITHFCKVSAPACLTTLFLSPSTVLNRFITNSRCTCVCLWCSCVVHVSKVFTASTRQRTETSRDAPSSHNCATRESRCMTMIPGVFDMRYWTSLREAVSQVEGVRLFRITGYKVSPCVLIRD